MTRRHLHVAAATCAILGALVGTLTPGEAHADARSTVTVNPVGLVDGYFNFEIETALGPVASFHAGVDFLVWDGVWSNPKDDTFAMGPILGFRLFPFMGAPAGLWVGPFAGLSYVRVSNGQSEATGAGTTFGGMLGYTLILSDIFVGSVGIGAGHTNFAKDIDGETVGRRQLEPRFRLSLGLAW